MSRLGILSGTLVLALLLGPLASASTDVGAEVPTTANDQWTNLMRSWARILNSPLTRVASTLIQGCYVGAGGACLLGFCPCFGLCCCWPCLSPLTAMIGCIIGSITGVTVELTFCIPCGTLVYNLCLSPLLET